MRRKISAALAMGGAALALAGAWAAPALAGGDYGPDTCLDGYVWRGVVPTDHVCVTSATRDQVAADNAAGQSLHVPGSEVCVQGYVWRMAVEGDRVCVTPARWDETQDDNLAREVRRNALDVFMGITFVHDPTCAEDETCQAPIPYYRLRVTRINVGRALVVLCKRGTADATGNGRLCRGGHDALVQSWRVAVQPSGAAPGGVMRWWRSPVQKCPGSWNAYFRVRDPSSGHWSSTRHVTTGCTNL
jgi:uncharacterized protein (DUF2237 family)